jgi:hypothetical protein
VRAISGATIWADWRRAPGPTVETVIVDGQTLVENGRATRLDEPALLRDVQAEGERLWQAIPQWHWTGRPLDEIVPPSSPVRGAH